MDVNCWHLNVNNWHLLLISIVVCFFYNWSYIILISLTFSLFLQHVDVVSYYLRKKRMTGELKESFTIMNSFFHSYCIKGYEAWLNCEDKDRFDWTNQSRIHDYITATNKSLKHSSPWVDVGVVYLPVCFTDRSHWLLLAVTIRERSIMIYDSLSGNKHHRKMVTAHVQKIAEFLPLVLCSVGAFDGLGIEDTSSSKFKVGTYTNMPQQNNGYVLLL